MPADWDVFVSYAHEDAEPVRRLCYALADAGLRVWLEETHVPEFESITDTVEAALAGSKALLAYYSPTYPTKRPCQWELTAAYVAAERVGDPRLRVLVVNPELDAGHIEPVTLRDARFAAAPRDRAEMAALGQRVARHVGALHEPLGELRAPSEPIWHGEQPLASARFV